MLSNVKNEAQVEYISIREASSISGIGKQTLRALVDQNKIKSYRTLSGQRKIDKFDILKMCSNDYFNETKSDYSKFNYIYTRVSSKKQLEDLSRQFEYVRSKDPSYESYLPLKDVGSGINFKRKGLETILDRCVQGSIGDVVIAHRDRLSRFGFELIKSFIEKAGGTLTVIDDDEHKSSEQELAEDLLSIVQIYSRKSNGRRGNSKVNKDKNQTNEDSD